MTSFNRKQRTVNSSDEIASQFKKELKGSADVKKLKSKNSELLAKYREKLRQQEGDENGNEIENQDSEKTTSVPKVKNDTFRGVRFDEDMEEEVHSQSSMQKKSSKGLKSKFSKPFKNKNQNSKNGRPTKPNNRKKFGFRRPNKNQRQERY